MIVVYLKKNGVISKTKRKHIELFLTKEGRGAGYARNTGLSHAKGKWIIFADADDFFYENAFVEFDKLSNVNSQF